MKLKTHVRKKYSFAISTQLGSPVEQKSVSSGILQTQALMLTHIMSEFDPHSKVLR